MRTAGLLLWRPTVGRTLLCPLFLFLSLQAANGMSGWGGCLDGQDVFAKVKENSPAGKLVAELTSDVTGDGVRWSLTGKDADWFFLDGRFLRLNTSPEKVLDREVQGTVLMAGLTCYEDDTFQSVYRIMVEILNENDNLPVFVESTVLTLNMSELTAANTVVFAVLAKDADDDKIIYSIDQTSPDAEYFKVDLPNSGEVMLAKPLDYESKTLITVTVHASEMNTAERFNTSATVTLHVVDGDDQYPHFLPCTLLLQDRANRICANPVYAVNVTEGEQDKVLDFSPGPIRAVDGDRGLDAPLAYTILSGADDGRVVMDNATAEVRLTRGVEDRLLTPTLQLRIMAYQLDDPRKYSVATVLIHVLAVNRFLPQFDRPEYRGFVVESDSPASLVNTYGSELMWLCVQDLDFAQGFNPKIQFTLSPTSNDTKFYQVTRDGLLIARTNQLHPKQRHRFEVVAVDQESGDTSHAHIVVEVLYDGQLIPQGPSTEGCVSGCTVGRALGLCGLFATVLACVLYATVWMLRRHHGHKSPLESDCVAQGKHRNVTLRWFQLVSQGRPEPHVDEVNFRNEAISNYTASYKLQSQPGIYIHKDLPSFRGPTPPSKTAPPDTSYIPASTLLSPVALNKVCSPVKIPPMPPIDLAFLSLNPDEMAPNSTLPFPGTPPIKLAEPRQGPPDTAHHLAAPSPSGSPGPAGTVSPPPKKTLVLNIEATIVKLSSNVPVTNPPVVCLGRADMAHNSAPPDRNSDAPPEPSQELGDAPVSSGPPSPSSSPSQTLSPVSPSPELAVSLLVTPPSPEQQTNPPPPTPVHAAQIVPTLPPTTRGKTSATASSTPAVLPSASPEQATVPAEKRSGSRPSERRPGKAKDSGEGAGKKTQEEESDEEENAGAVAVCKPNPGENDSDSDHEFDEEDERLMRAMARLNPTFITF
ncbi:uncharacterized protein FYW47_009166 [Aplochiton taeniatus]